jgi:alpha-N-arabinofuranosidase
MASTETRPLVEFIDGDQPRIEVFASQRAARAISPYLFGEFTEHLGSNVYSGAWAQILDNTGFEPARYFSWEEDAGVSNWLERDQDHDLLGSFRSGVACFWGRWGKGDVTYSPTDDRVNSDQAQRIEVRKLQSEEAGLLQPISLPTHRTGKYEVSVWAKGTVSKLHIAIRAEDGSELGGAEIAGVTGEWKQFRVRFGIDRGSVGKFQGLLLTIGASETGKIMLDQCMLFPADHAKGWDPEVIRFVKNSKITMLRFPGGNFVSGYHWKDGVGDIDKRPMSRNPAWGIAEPNHVGTDEWLAFCAQTGCEPLICVNAGNGTPEEAAHWVEYCNGGPDTDYGRLRAQNGHPEPYNVRYWEVGNELWGDWQIGHCAKEEYAERYRAFYDAMRKADPSILFIANGHDWLPWNEPVLKQNPKTVRSLSIHTLIGNAIPVGTEPDAVYNSLMAYTNWYEGHLRAMGKQMTDVGIADPKIAITELQIFTNRGEWPANWNQSEVVFYAGIMNSSIRTDMVEIITHSALVNHGGGLSKWRQVVCEQPVFLARKMYATQPGRWPVRLKIISPTYDVTELPGMPAVENTPYLDAVALLDNSGKELNILVTNRHPSEAITATIHLQDFAARWMVSVQTLAGKTYLDANSPGAPDVVQIQRSVGRTQPTGMEYTFPAHSLVRLRFRRS